jgi:hypothetical protein
MNRRRFLARAGIVATWAVIPISVSSCGNDDDPTDPGGTINGATGSVSSNAGHSHGGATVTEAQLSAGNAVTLTLTGSGHNHSVNLSAQNLLDIGDGTRVVVQSSNNGHSHTVTFN